MTDPGTGRRRADAPVSWPIRLLIDRLRGAGLRVGPREFEQALLVIAREPAWSRERLRNLLAVLLIAAPSDRHVFDALFDATFPTEADPVDPFGRFDPATARSKGKGTGPQTPDGTSDLNPPPTPPRERSEIPELQDEEGRTGLAAIGGMIWAKLLGDGLGLAIVFLVVCGVVALGFVALTPSLPEQIKPSVYGGPPVLAVAVAALTAAGLLGSALFALRWITRKEPVIERPPKPPPPPTGHLVFRIGLVGGRQPDRVEPGRMKSIVDLFGYSAGSEDERELDTDRTIQAVIHAAGMPTIRHPLERVLPLVLILVDAASPGRHWNTTPDELTKALSSRGLEPHRRNFDGSLHASVAGTADAALQPTPLGREIGALADETPYLVVMIFSDGARWRDADTRLVASLAPCGPVLWFDDRDRELWDVRLDALRRARIPIYEATGLGVEEALRFAYAPGRGVGTPAKQAGAALARRRIPTLEDEVRALLGSAVGWARHCALIEPISVALAEQIRQRFHPALPWIVFSRFCALPGTVIGPEGLRFEPRVRSLLLFGLARHEPTRLRDRVVAFIGAELDKAGEGLADASVAQSLYRLAAARVAIHSRPDEAVREIASLREANLVEAEPIDRFLKAVQPLEPGGTTRVVPPEGVSPIPIAAPLRQSATIDVLMDARPHTGRERRLPVWSVAAPEFRMDLEGQPIGDEPLAVFVREGELVLRYRFSQGENNDAFLSIALPAGVRSEWKMTFSGRQIPFDARNGIIAAASAEGQPCGYFPVSASASASASATGRYRLANGEPMSGKLNFMFVSARNGLVAAASRSLIQVIGPEGPLRTLSTQSYNLYTAGCDYNDEMMLVGSNTGRLVLEPWQEGSPKLGTASVAGPVDALAIASRDDGGWRGARTVAAAYRTDRERPDGSAFVAVMDVDALEDGLAARRQRVLPLAAMPRSLELSPDGATLLVIMDHAIDLIDTQSGLSILAPDSLASLGSVGVQGEEAAHVAAASLTGRRIAIVLRDPPRLEVRRLERQDFEDGTTSKTSSQEAAPVPAE